MKKVALLSGHPVGRKMAGPGIRYYKLAETLSRFFEVTLFVPQILEKESFPFQMKLLKEWKWEKNRYDFLITQGYRIPLSYILNFKGVKIVDMYTPLVVEYLEHTSGRRQWKHRGIVAKTLILLKKADVILVANERQVLFYAGLMSGWGMLGSKEFLRDPSLLQKFIILPSGIDEEIPSSKGLLKKKGIKEDKDFIFVWNGGLWRWFDPLLPLKGVKVLREEGRNTKLLFLGKKTPSREESEIELTEKVIKFADERNLLGEAVFFYDEWVEYELTKSIVAECDAGVCAFRKTLETMLSFRTRFLDYLECGIPVVWTEGDYFSEFVKKGSGICVLPEDEDAFIEGMRKMIDERDRYKEKMIEFRSLFFWKKLIAPLLSFMNNQ